MPALAGRKVVSIDGFVCNGKVTHYCISDNVYKAAAPEEFDSLVTPSQRLSAAEIAACWAKYDTVTADLIRRGLDNQFLDVEAFVLDVEGRATVTTMEVNCRTFCNQLPVFSRLFGNACMLSTAVDLLLGKPPAVGMENFSSSVLLPSESAPTTPPAVGVCAYLSVIPAVRRSSSRRRVMQCTTASHVSLRKCTPSGRRERPHCGAGALSSTKRCRTSTGVKQGRPLLNAEYTDMTVSSGLLLGAPRANRSYHCQRVEYNHTKLGGLCLLYCAENQPTDCTR